jgi:hypothetical protein
LEGPAYVGTAKVLVFVKNHGYKIG